MSDIGTDVAPTPALGPPPPTVMGPTHGTRPIVPQPGASPHVLTADRVVQAAVAQNRARNDQVRDMLARVVQLFDSLQLQNHLSKQYHVPDAHQTQPNQPVSHTLHQSNSFDSPDAPAIPVPASGTHPTASPSGSPRQNPVITVSQQDTMLAQLNQGICGYHLSEH